MNQRVFRKVSLERLSSPEQLDQLITIISPKGWLALMGMLIIVTTGILWGIFGSIPTKVEGDGILVKSGGVYNLTNTKSGILQDLSVTEGELVAKGEIIGRMDVTPIVDEIIKARRLITLIDEIEEKEDFKDLEYLPSELFTLYEYQGKIKEAVGKRDIQYQQTTKDSPSDGATYKEAQVKREQRIAQIQLDTAREQLMKIENLYNDGAVSMTKWTEAKLAVERAQLDQQLANEALDNFLSLQQDQRSAKSYEKSMNQLYLQQSEERVEQLKEQYLLIKKSKKLELEMKVKELQEKAERDSLIISPVSGRVVEVKVSKGDPIAAGSEIISLEKEGSDINDLEVVLYIPAEKGKQITPGMKADVSPSVVKKEEFGYVIGRVVSVSEFPVSGRKMLKTLGDKNLASSLADGSPMLEVRINLIPDDSTDSGYRWSTRFGPPIKINSGTLCKGAITVKSQSPIRLLIPEIKKRLPIAY